MEIETGIEVGEGGGEVAGGDGHDRRRGGWEVEACFSIGFIKVREITWNRAREACEDKWCMVGESTQLDRFAVGGTGTVGSV
ncbi:hypothetical protein GH714_039805 [Hevea brasiliensis]|uniref:Uncharacterized protein n=1 Tax=Hevea brasiliensis TaxID=3981 RepID=A0A6A6KEV1_HEVBR|nr:hypothetical protein GH714_039805 [Hevea brasiliensis]